MGGASADGETDWLVIMLLLEGRCAVTVCEVCWSYVCAGVVSVCRLWRWHVSSVGKVVLEGSWGGVGCRRTWVSWQGVALCPFIFRIFEDCVWLFSGLKQMKRMEMHMTIQIVARLVIYLSIPFSICFATRRTWVVLLLGTTCRSSCVWGKGTGP